MDEGVGRHTGLDEGVATGAPAGDTAMLMHGRRIEDRDFFEVGFAEAESRNDDSTVTDGSPALELLRHTGELNRGALEPLKFRLLDVDLSFDLCVIINDVRQQVVTQIARELESQGKLKHLLGLSALIDEGEFVNYINTEVRTEVRRLLLDYARIAGQTLVAVNHSVNAADDKPIIPKGNVAIYKDMIRAMVSERVSEMVGSFYSQKVNLLDYRVDKRAHLLTGEIADAYLAKTLLVDGIPAIVITGDMAGMTGANEALSPSAADDLMGGSLKKMGDSVRAMDLICCRQQGGDEVVGVMRIRPEKLAVENVMAALSRPMNALNRPTLLRVPRAKYDELVALEQSLAAKITATKGLTDKEIKTYRWLKECVLPGAYACDDASRPGDGADDMMLPVRQDMRFAAVTFTPEYVKEHKLSSQAMRAMVEQFEAQAKALQKQAWDASLRGRDLGVSMNKVGIIVVDGKAYLADFSADEPKCFSIDTEQEIFGQLSEAA